MQDEVQEAPLALIKKARSQNYSPLHPPVINIGIQHRDMLDASLLKPSASTLPPQSQKTNATLSGKKIKSSSSPLNLSKSAKPYLHCRRNSLGDHDDDDSGSNLSGKMDFSPFI